MECDTHNSFLLIRFSSLGDILLLAPALRCLRKAYASARIDVLTHNRYQELLEGNPNITSVITYDKTENGRTLKELKQRLKNRYSTIIDLHSSLRSFFFRRALNAAHILVYNKRRLPRWFLVKFKHNHYGTQFSVPLAYIEAMAPLGVKDDGEGLQWQEAFRQREKFLSLTGIAETPSPEPIGICPGASFATKRWSIENWLDLAGNLLKKGYQLWVFGDPSDWESGELLRQLNPGLINNFCGKLSISESGAGMSFCRAVITHDAGPSHMASAVGVPVVAIFGPTVVDFGFRPFRTPHRIAEVQLKCRPCSHLGGAVCPLKHHRCMTELSPKHVLELFSNLIKEST